ncbi:HhH-GPD-type base excision DNA repair protein [Kineosporia sp. NBRC 101731]|uniref:HhH-GPD-type base excision DNA repair protein n=1 Tax=Kineosporia sp. NBRC 101731 TaxID=3032199 RepID=UPI0024A311EA|nr:HhH-GPD-type base excision DNA repair protein [Kineosporia sp. NBRC 101731]GLY33305.1 (Fe-S)-cluster assembly protein [Kineosporia sp. NBRC 101731]
MTLRIRLAQQEAADDLLGRDPFALLTGMLLDQQVPMEKAFAGPRLIADRLGTDGLDPELVAATDPERFTEIMTGPPAVHRYPKSMGARVQDLARAVVEGYGGDASAVWRDVTTGTELYKRLNALPGYGPQKAKIFVALLGKQAAVRPEGWRKAAGDYGLEGFRSVADVTDDDSLLKVRDHKKSVKAAAKAAQG